MRVFDGTVRADPARAIDPADRQARTPANGWTDLPADIIGGRAGEPPAR